MDLREECIILAHFGNQCVVALALGARHQIIPALILIHAFRAAQINFKESDDNQDERQRRTDDDPFGHATILTDADLFVCGRVILPDHLLPEEFQKQPEPF